MKFGAITLFCSLGNNSAPEFELIPDVIFPDVVAHLAVLPKIVKRARHDNPKDALTLKHRDSLNGFL
jgi:hypothetical protein